MSDAIDLLTAHFERMRGRSFDVDLGEVGTLTIHHDPVTTSQMQRIRQRAGADEIKLTVYTVIYLAKDAQGARLFEDDARTVKALTEESVAGVVADIARRIMDASPAEELGN